MTTTNSNNEYNDLKDFSFYNLKNLKNYNFKFYIESIQISVNNFNYDDSNIIDDKFYFKVNLKSNSKPLLPTTVTKFNRSITYNECNNIDEDNKVQIEFDLLIDLPINFNNLPLNSKLELNLLDNNERHLGGCVVDLFSNNYKLKSSKKILCLNDNYNDDDLNELKKFNKIKKLINKNDLNDLNWLNTLSDERINYLNDHNHIFNHNFVLYLHLPKFNFPIIYNEDDYLLPLNLNDFNQHQLQIQSANLPTNDNSNFISEQLSTSIVDPDNDRPNPLEIKHRRLVRSHSSGLLDRELKPNAKIRDELNDIISYPPTKELLQSEKNLIWKFRFYLVRNKRALTKFLKSVTWFDQSEVNQAIEILLPMWNEPDTEDALELLGPSFSHPIVRSYGVNLLSRADDDELLLYLLQLVQALKFNSSKFYKKSHNKLFEINIDQNLLRLLIDRSIQNPILTNQFYWYLMVECNCKVFGKYYAKVAHLFLTKLVETSNGNDKREVLKHQAQLIENLTKIAKKLKLSKDSRPKKIENLRNILNENKKIFNNNNNECLPLPLDANINIKGIKSELSSVFKSNLFPMLLYFEVDNYNNDDNEDNNYFPVIFKEGDDLRQDQLVIQLFTLMDKLLRKENLDLKLKLFKVLATDSKAGMVQYIKNKTLSSAVNDHGSVIEYLKYNHPNHHSLFTYGIEPYVLDNFVKSCAGYCVMTFLLGIGDRHLDNLLISPDGHFFHVDFGYILGRDPKPFPPLLKISKEMVDGMGGPNSNHYQRFKILCFTAYTTLRKNANLILNLISLMINANIPDIQIEPDKAVLKVQEKFRLDLSEEDAIKHFETLLNETSYLSAVFDQIHNIAQYWRS